MLVMLVSLVFPAVAVEQSSQVLTRGELKAIAAKLENGEEAFAESAAVVMEEGDEPPR